MRKDIMELYDHDEVRCDAMVDADLDNKLVGEARTCCICSGHDCELARAERLRHPEKRVNNEANRTIQNH